MRELKYYVACTVDRFIAREDGSFDFFLSEGEHIAALIQLFPETFPGHLRDALGVRAANRWFDAVLMGRRTYEVGINLGVTNPYPHMKQYLFSRTLMESPDENVQLVLGGALAFIRELKKQPGKDIWLCGGGDLATALFPEIDEVVLKVNPILLGSGIPLFSGVIKETDLELADSTVYSNGFMLVRYRIRQQL
jgi:dihydrofolate reductase